MPAKVGCEGRSGLGAQAPTRKNMGSIPRGARIQNTEYRIQKTEYRIQNREYRKQNPYSTLQNTINGKKSPMKT
jgi:hypothetical protein